MERGQCNLSKGKLCLFNLLEYFKHVNKIVDAGEVDMTYLYFQKAFDKVAHSRLLRKLKNTVMSGKLAKQ